MANMTAKNMADQRKETRKAGRISRAGAPSLSRTLRNGSRGWWNGRYLANQVT